MIEDHLQAIERSIAAIREEMNPPEPNTDIVFVDNQTDLQLAVDGLANVTVRVKPGTYDSLILREGKKNLIIESDTELPVGRVGNDWSDALVKIKSFKAEGKAEGYLLHGLQFLQSNPDYSIVSLGTDKDTDPFNTPNDITFDQCIVNANPDTGGKRGLAFHCRKVNFMNSRAEGFYWRTPDSQAIIAYNCPGPVTIYNSSLSGSAECFMAGGGDTLNEQMQLDNLYFLNNHCWKPLEWKADPTIVVKNIFELKDTKHALVENNLFENNWKDDQTGYGIVFTPRNQNNRQPFVIVSNVDFKWNVVRNCGAGISILGDDNLAPSLQTININIMNNLMYDIDTVLHPGSAGRLFYLSRSPKMVSIKNNTCIGNKLNSFLDIEHNPELLLVYDNIFTEGSYGLKTPAGLGLAAFNTTCIESEFRGNVITPSNVRTINYGTTNVKMLQADALTESYKSKTSAGVDIDMLHQKVLF